MFIKYTTLIFDLGDVLFNWSSQTKTAISPTTLKGMLSSPTWFEYECGKISQDSCYERIGNQFAFDPSEVANAFAQAQDSLQANNELVSFIRQLKAESNSILRVYAMSNVSRPDYQALRMKLVDWSIFDQVFTSGEVGERKPALAFYRHVLEATGADPQSTIFVDDKSDNVLSARSIGIHGIIFDNTQQVTRALRNLVGDPVKRGKEFLEMNSKSLKSTIEGGKTLDDNFMQLLILEATNNR
jgi:HAD superfamily hydrolase (TIGR01509 family)